MKTVNTWGQFYKHHIKTSLLVFVILWPVLSTAGFLEMPEITEMPELERKSMLKDLDIPSVRERDPDPEAGPRLNVEKFKLQGIVEYPELGITRADIEKLIEGIRYDLMEEYKVLDSGFTEEELEEVSNLLGEIEDETIDRHVTDVDVQRLVWLVREQRSKRGITLGQIETVADRITKFYRERGFILAKAYIPEQQVRDGIVTLTLLLGTLGEVRVTDNQLYDTESITSVFDDDLAKPVTSAVTEENLYLLNDYPGLSVVGFFEPGDQVGDTRLQLKVQDEKQFSAFARVDDHGSKQTGLYRLYVEGQANNLAHLSDQLTLGILHSFSPGNTNYGQVGYSASLFSPRFFVSGDLSTNQFVLGKGSDEDINLLDLYGSTESSNLSFLYKLKRSRVSTHSLTLTGSHISSQLESDNDLISLDGLLDNTVDMVSLQYNFDVLDEENRRLHQGNVAYHSGHLDTGLDLGDASKEPDFSILTADYTLLTFWQLPFIETKTRILLRSSLQYSAESLSSINQFSLAGPTVAKAFPVNTFSADSAIYTGIEWILDKPELLDGISITEKYKFNDLFQPYLFLDGAYGIQKNQSGDKDAQARLLDGGLGMRFNYTQTMSGNMQFAFPLQKSFIGTDLDESNDGMRFVFDFQYSFL